MKRFILCLTLGVGLLSGCSDSQTVQTAAGLSGTYDVARVGQYLFVTSSDRDELRVLDLASSPRDWVRAPNPLESLSIPVLPRPSNLTRDMRYEVVNGQVNEGPSGPYVYARSFGSREVSIVVADPEYTEYFKELKRLEAPGLVTAFAARGPEGTRTQSVLYLAVQNGEDAELYRANLPAPDVLTGETPVTLELNATLPGKTVTALLPLPAPLGQEAQDPQPLVVSTRNTMGVGGEAFRMEANNPQAPRVPYQFGAAVRLLATHPRAEIAPSSEEKQGEWRRCLFDPDEGLDAKGQPKPPAPLAAGQYVFGILDEHSCGAQQECSGVLAVDAATGERAKDVTGLPMIPISVGGALPTGLTLAAGTKVRLNCKIQEEVRDAEGKVVQAAIIDAVVRRPLVGIVPASNGVITLFDAVRMRPFDADYAPASADYVLVDNTGATKTVPATELKTHLRVQVTEGVTQNDTYRLLYQIALPDLLDLPRTDVACPAGAPGNACFTLNPSAAQTVEVGDVVVLRGDAGACIANGSEVDFTVTEKREAAGSPTLIVTTRPATLPAGCEELPRFSVRAAGARPFVVFSDTKGYLGRLGEGQSLAVPGRYYYHPSPQLEPEPKDVVLTVNFKAREVERGNQYIVTTPSHYLPFVFGVDTGGLGVLSAYRLPGPVVYTQVGDADFAYIAYPSADGILQVSLDSVVDNAANARGLVPFE